jgi:CheY-like chemotaxis protein
MGCRVMVVDDSEADLLFARIVLERAEAGFEVLPYESAREALARLQDVGAAAVDLVLLDINMPGMNGFEFLDAFDALPAAQRRSAVMVMLTSSPDPSDRERALAHRCVRGYITKPMSAQAVGSLLRHVAG